ncbi:GxxExxY protein [Marinifilum sp. D714]|uniref:GxxExxY protein n=1 Tax=Marinifilum sp. D714 TaxID=2937523 RepID=UPI0027C0C543|nr:GxxExxY protein [Marinifilum sp. D714]MDQ2179393.1 GxxExxY protein [Marinifilum sp. D714]
MIENYKYTELTDKIIEAFYKVYNQLGIGFQEKVYENALLIELDKRLLDCEKQKNIKVYYEGQLIGDYYADIVVNESVIIELKAVESIRFEHEVQLVNYLRATNIEVGLLLNFGNKPQIKRKVFANSRKVNLNDHMKS